ncbi:MAG: phospho-N-acetylmuramoyl-pentapeptide-transferase [Actinobacteria bacterium]|nr:phospho-N-acetylmuramoyl-pentapeptide-transferase [Actinomycetota bacterium]
MRLVVVAGAVAFLISFIITPWLIKVLKGRKLAQAIRVSGELNFPKHEGKQGTPSMGGLAILAGIIGGYAVTHVLWHRAPSASGWLALYLTVGLAMVGFADDYLKVFRSRSMGLRARTKLIGQGAIALSFAALAQRFPDSHGNTPVSSAISLVRDTHWVLPGAVLLVWVWLLTVSTTNAVNLTDGLDGLASGAAVFTFAAYTIVCIWQYGQRCTETGAVLASCYTVRNSLDLGIFAAACAGAVFAFLWWNTAPAGIFMGDTGSLAIGGAIAALAMMSRTELLLPLFGGLFVVEALSLIAQVTSFRLTGKRVLRMSPLHHHFEMLGWPEVQIVTRFWIMHGVFIAVGMAVFYAEWVH